MNYYWRNSSGLICRYVESRNVAVRGRNIDLKFTVFNFTDGAVPDRSELRACCSAKDGKRQKHAR